MILANGKRYESAMQDTILSGLAAKLNQTLAKPAPTPELVISAIDKLGRTVEAGVFDAQIDALQL